jgi:hypothetical protein
MQVDVVLARRRELTDRRLEGLGVRSEDDRIGDRVLVGPLSRRRNPSVAASRFAAAACGKQDPDDRERRPAMAKSHGSSVKDDKQYEGLRKKGMSKERAAKIANTKGASKKGGKKSGKKS